VFRLAEDEGLIAGAETMDGGIAVLEITPRGRAVLSGEVRSPFDPPTPTSQTNNFHGPVTGVQIGDNNTQHVDARLQSIVETIQKADIPAAEKKQALDKLRAFASDPAVSNVIQGAGVIAQMLGG